ncbi:MAG: FAD-dependent oxidoreductase [Phycisphaerae bacterium]|jgi:NAD(P)H-nitrite reductase large subunit
MAAERFRYVIVGGGLAGASAVEGIREVDQEGRILLISSEKHLPYHRPPLSKQLWFGKKKVQDIFVKGQEFYDSHGVEVALSRTVVSLDAGRKTLTDSAGQVVSFEKLLLATGGIPRRLDIPGGDLAEVCYYRFLDDYLAVRPQAAEGKAAVVVGGGFIGSEIAAALHMNHVSVTMVFPGEYLCDRVFPAELGRAIQEQYRQRGIEIFSADRSVGIAREGSRLAVQTKQGRRIEADLVIVGIGIAPATELAAGAGLAVENGIVANEYLQTAQPDIYAAGDNASFPYKALGVRTRIEHWDGALSEGKCAGRNMAGAGEPFTYMPYFYSDLFKFGYEAVGDVNSKLETFADWQKVNDTGVVYYLQGGRVRGVMLCNVWNKLDAARQMILGAKPIQPRELAGAIVG